MSVRFTVDITNSVVAAEQKVVREVLFRLSLLEGDSSPIPLVSSPRQITDERGQLMYLALVRQFPKIALAAVDQVCINADLPTTSSLLDHIAGREDSYWHQFLGIREVDALHCAYSHFREELVSQMQFFSEWPGLLLSEVFLSFISAVRASLARQSLHNWCLGDEFHQRGTHVNAVLQLAHFGEVHGYLGASLIPMSDEPASFLK